VNFGSIKIGDKYWFPDATRYIGYNPPVEDKTIHEFPSYSFVVSDLHAHVIDVMFVITIIAVIFMYMYKNLNLSNQGYSSKWYKISLDTVIIGFFIGIFQMTNYWDFPIYFTVATFATLYVSYIKYKNLKYSALYCCINLVTIFIISYLVSLPFKLNFFNFSNGIHFTPTHSPLYQLLVLWGYQLFFVVYFVFYLFFREKKLLKLQNKKIKKQKNIKPSATKLSERLEMIQVSDIFTIIMAISAIGLIIIPEIVYVKDIYPVPYHRSNTMFKLTYQSFIMFCITTGYIIPRIFAVKYYSVKRSIFQLSVAVIIMMPLLYPFWSIGDWYGSDDFEYKTLNGGMETIAKEYPTELQYDVSASEWLNSLKGQPAILEAAGDSYTRYARMSTSTGLPTVIGWYVHEWLWHNRNDFLDTKRSEVETVYTSNDINETLSIIKKYDIKYIVLGKLERDKYPQINEQKLLKMGNVVFENTGTKIIKVF
jgi:YYY domain-containing protein